MNHYTIDILKSDILYVIEAIRMRGYAIAEQVSSQIIQHDQAEMKAAKAAQQESWTITATQNQAQAAKGPAKKAAKKRGRPAKKSRVPLVRTPEAPYGLKKDGTPRARPGRKIPAAS